MHSLRAKSILLVSLFIIFAAYSSVYADITVSINYYGQDHYGYEASSVNAKAGDTYSLHVVNHSGGSINWKWTWLGPQDQGVWLTSIGSKNVDARFIPFNTNNWLYTFTVEIWKTGEGEGGGPHTIDGSGAINQPDITITEPVVDKYVAKDSETTVSVTATVGHGEEGWANQPVTIWILKNGTGSPLYSHNLTTGGSGTATYQYSPGSWDTAEHETRAKINDPIKTYVDEGNYSITVLEVELGFKDSKVIDPLAPPRNVRIGVIKGDSITFKSILTPEVTLENEEYSWTGTKTGTGPEISITFNSTGNKNETLTVLEVARTATTTVIYVPLPNKYLWAILNPLTWPTVQSLGNEALEWSPGHNGVGDAKRHTYWNVLMTVEINATDAEGASTAYERSNLGDGGKHNEIVMDMENNANGRSIAGGLPPNPSRTVCQNAVISASNAGALTILDNLANSNEVGLLQPSNQ